MRKKSAAKGPLKEIVKGTVIGKTPCRIGCGRENQLKVNSGGWPYVFCPSKTGCGDPWSTNGIRAARNLVNKSVINPEHAGQIADAMRGEEPSPLDVQPPKTEPIAEVVEVKTSIDADVKEVAKKKGRMIFGGLVEVV